MGTKYLRYVPNTDHSLANSDAAESLQAFYDAILNNKPLPQFSWTKGTDGSLHLHTLTEPLTVKLWQATNPDARDFRLQTIGPAYTSTILTDLGGGNYLANIPPPPKGWTAFFIEMTYASGGLYPYTFTTEVSVVPEPASWATLSVGALCLAGAACARRGRKGRAPAAA